MSNDKGNEAAKLLEIIDVMVKKQEELVKDIHILRMTVIQLREAGQAEAFIEPEIRDQESPLADDVLQIPQILAESHVPTGGEPAEGEPIVLSEADDVDPHGEGDDEFANVPPEFMHIPEPPVRTYAPRIKSNIEKFVGENILNVIGICITVIGVAIGIKYSIDNELISPLTRVILSFLFGLGLLGFGIRLKEKYEGFSAVLVGGAMTILYFSTYIAYGAYALIGWTIAFSFMVMFTIFTVIAAIRYNRQIIAHIGLVGAYAVPFLLSDGSGNVGVLFAYIAVINAGILVIALRRYWKPLYYASFGLTWLMYASWYTEQYRSSEHSSLALMFAFTFFAEFYGAFLAYKSLHAKKYIIDDIILIVTNASLFYGFGYAVCDSEDTLRPFLGAFTLLNAVLHFVPGFLLYRKSDVDRNVRYLVVGLVIVFLTTTVPVQLDGNWVTSIWAGEALLLFSIGRSRKVKFFELLSYPLMALAFGSITQDWQAYEKIWWDRTSESGFSFLLNVNFLNSLLFIAAFATILILMRRRLHEPDTESKPNQYEQILSGSVSAVLVFAVYNAFRLEIDHYWEQLYIFSGTLSASSAISWGPDSELLTYRDIWRINFHLLFLSLCGLANLRWVRNRIIGVVTFGLLALSLGYFFTVGMYDLSRLRWDFITRNESLFYERTVLNLWTRYFSLTFVAFALYACHSIVRRGELDRLKGPRTALFHGALFLIANTELIHWLDLRAPEESYKLGMSILWSVYSLVLIVVGIWKRKKPQRLGGIVLFGVTMVKIFFFDIDSLSTIEKTVVFVFMGVLLLISSFLYNKYKHIITNEEAS